MIKLANLNQISDQLLAEIPTLLPGELKTFECLWGVKIHDAENSEKITLAFGKRRFNLKDKIHDPYNSNSNKSIDIGIPVKIENGNAVEFLKFAPGETENVFSGRFSLSGDNPEHVDIFEFLMLSNRLSNNKYRSKREPAEIKLLGVVEDTVTNQLIRPPKLVDTSKPKEAVRETAFVPPLIEEDAELEHATEEAVKGKSGRKTQAQVAV